MVAEEVWAFAVELLRGRVLEVTDGAGMVWRASATRLCWVVAGEPIEVRKGDAFEVAAHLARELRRKARRASGRVLVT